jgi:hypothetical protein
MTTRFQVRTAASDVSQLVVAALTEVTSANANFSQSQTLVTSIEDAIFAIDSEAAELAESSVLPTVDPQTLFSTGVLPTRESMGKLQRIRSLRNALYGDGVTGAGSIAGLKTLLAEWS